MKKILLVLICLSCFAFANDNKPKVRITTLYPLTYASTGGDKHIKKIRQKKYIKPPIDLNDISIKTALQIIFSRADNTPFSIDTDLSSINELSGTINLGIDEEKELDLVLNHILKIRGLDYHIDNSGVYHIIKPGEEYPRKITKKYAMTWTCAQEGIIKVLKEGFLYSQDHCIKAPYGISGLPIKAALEKLFADCKAGLSIDVGYIANYGGVSLCIKEDTTLNTILKQILEPKGLIYVIDSREIYHIKE